MSALSTFVSLMGGKKKVTKELIAFTPNLENHIASFKNYVKLDENESGALISLETNKNGQNILVVCTFRDGILTDGKEISYLTRRIELIVDEINFSTQPFLQELCKAIINQL